MPSSTERTRKFRLSHPNYQREWFAAHPEQQLSYQRKYRKEHPLLHRNDNARYRKNNPEKIRAHNIANKKIQIPQGQLCERCGVVLASEKHHPDYSKPLEVRFVCEKCHTVLDKEKKNRESIGVFGDRPVSNTDASLSHGA